MKFLITGDLYSKRGLYYGVLSFLVIAIMFWLSSFFNFYFKYGFSYDSIFRYYFTDQQFPERISLQQLSEDFHISTFILSFFYLMTASILAVTEFNYRLKTFIIVLSGVATLFYCVSDFGVFLSPDILVYSKLTSFIVFQTSFGLMLFISIVYLTRRKSSGRRIALQKVVIYSYGLLTLLFILSLVFIYYSKFGSSISGIKEYFLGNPEKFKRPKTVEGVFKSFYPHILMMALFSFTISHLASFSSGEKRMAIVLGVVLMLVLSIENLSSLLILLSGEVFSYIKAGTFYLSLFLSLLLVLSIYSFGRMRG
ncbi:MAG: hypothetical protein N2Z80_04450 [Hydrogenothermaceae bacterium]|nr:hypothetical protein [Hydrogenothermaceae bacterium]